MSYEKLFTRFGSPSKEAEIRITGYLQHPAKLTLDRIPYNDQVAARVIASCEGMIEKMKEYRQALAARYAELSTASYRLRLELKREAGWYRKGITYYVTIYKIYEDGTEIEELREHYPGKERHKALSRFEELKKQRPGIETTKDIEKRSWER